MIKNLMNMPSIILLYQHGVLIHLKQLSITTVDLIMALGLVHRLDSIMDSVLEGLTILDLVGLIGLVLALEDSIDLDLGLIMVLVSEGLEVFMTRSLVGLDFIRFTVGLIIDFLAIDSIGIT